MATQKIEGTFYIDGLLEGPIYSQEDENNINRIVRVSQKRGLVLIAAFDGGRFSILADSGNVQVNKLNNSVDNIVVQFLDDLIGNYSPDDYTQIMSTLRSIEYIEGYEIQTLYGIKHDGTVSVNQRTVEADTVKPAQPLSWQYKIKIAVIFLIILSVVFGISSFFVPYRDMARRFIAKAKPFKKENLKIDTQVFSNYFSIDAVEIDVIENVITIACKTSDNYPDTDEKINKLWKSSENSISQSLAVEALNRNSLRCLFFDFDGKYMGQVNCYMDLYHLKEVSEKLK
jgi:hypothetical protein